MWIFKNWIFQKLIFSNVDFFQMWIFSNVFFFKNGSFQMWIFSNADFWNVDFFKYGFLIKWYFRLKIFSAEFTLKWHFGVENRLHLMYCKNSIHSLTSRESNMTLMTSQSWTRCTLALCDTGTKYQVKLSRVYPACKFFFTADSRVISINF